MKSQILKLGPVGRTLILAGDLGANNCRWAQASLLLGKEVKGSALCLVDHLPQSTEILPTLGPAPWGRDKADTYLL